MKFFCVTSLTLLLSIGLCAAQAPAAQAAPTGTDLYHVHFAKAALGKAVQLADLLKKPTPNAPMPGHSIVLRHQSGDEWDYLVIQHLGSKATIDATTAPPPPGERDLREWHNDTFVSGPPWAEFSRMMGIGEGSTGTSASLYVVGTHRAAPGHRDEVVKILKARDEGDLSAGGVVMQHVEGATWQLLSIDRYNSWQDYATSETKAKAEMDKGTSGGWFRVREHVVSHRDTLADRIAP